MSAKHQAVLVNDPECFVKPLPTIYFTKGTDVSGFGDGYVVIGLDPVSSETENDIFRYVPAAGDFGDYIVAKRPCTLVYSGVVMRSNTGARGQATIAAGDESTYYGQGSPTFFSSVVVAPIGEGVIGISGAVVLNTGEGVSFLLDNDSVDTIAVHLTVTSVNPA